MKIAHLILAHKNPAQLERMLNAMDHPQFDFFIHLDRKTDISAFIYLEKRKNVFFVSKRASVRWACYSLVQAQLNGLEEILSRKEYDYINVMSAQDFPLYSPETIYRYFIEHSGTEFISAKTFSEEKEWWTEAMHRIKGYHFQNWRIPGKYRLQFLVNKILPERKYPLDHVIVGRSQWFSITEGCAVYIIEFLKQHPEVEKFFKYVWGADEFIFSTIVFNSAFRDKISDTLMYTDWSERKPNPKILTSKDYNALVASGKLFARKFDIDVDANIFTMLEDRLRKKALYTN
jgi:hypothetical protein